MTVDSGTVDSGTVDSGQWDSGQWTVTVENVYKSLGNFAQANSNQLAMSSRPV